MDPFDTILTEVSEELTASKESGDLKNLLEAWNMTHMFDTLKDEKITVQVLKIVQYHHLQDLLQKFKIGDRITFEFHLEKWRNQMDNPLQNRSPGNALESPIFRSRSSSLLLASPSLESVDKVVSIADILKLDPKSSVVSQFFEINNRLDNANRNLLINLVVNYFLKNKIHMSLQTSYELEKEILTLFPSEKLDFYRTEKRGKLYIKYCNLKSTSTKVNEVANKPAGSFDTQIESIVPEEDAQNFVHSLKYDNLSADEFDSYWRSCSNYRIKEIWKKSSNIQEILNMWPQYKKPSGYRLIDLDFRTIFNYEGLSNDSWESKIKKIYLFLKMDNHIKDTTIKLILNSISEYDVEHETTSFAFKTLWCLHGYLIPTMKVVRKDIFGKKDTSRFSIKDSQESFIFVGQSLQQLDDHINFLEKRGENIQPFILAYGDKTYSSFEQFFLYLDGTKILFTSLLRCIDICFKVFHLFNLEYPNASSVFWTFFEMYFYKLNKSATLKSSKISILLQELEQNSI